MPKLKSHRGAAKRFRRTGTGKIKRRRANRNHMLTLSKTSKQKRHLRVSRKHAQPSDEKAINRMLDGC